MQNLSRDELYVVLEKCMSFMRSDESFLLTNDISERCITHKYAIYLENELSAYFEKGACLEGFSVDCEYNRLTSNDSEQVKKVLYKHFENSDEDIDSISVFPDIIVHKRGSKEEEANFLVIEAKKDNCPNMRLLAFDKQKLLWFKKQLNYKYSAFLEFPIGNTEAQGSICLEP